MASSPTLILRILRAARFRNWAGRQFRDPPRETGSLDPRKVKRSLTAKAWFVEGFKLLTISGDSSGQEHVIYFPGGAYLLEATPFHRRFAETLASKFGLTVTIIDYPKAPEHTFRTTHELVQAAYRQLKDRYPQTTFSLMGDSAGGGLALAFLISLRDQGFTPLPAKTVLISPWLDLSLSHPDLPAYVPRDLVLPLDGLQDAAQLYAGDEDLQNPNISPLFGDLRDLGQILLLFGTEELFYPDCQVLIDKIGFTAGTSLEWMEGENQIHAWPIFPFPDSRGALERIVDFLTNN